MDKAKRAGRVASGVCGDCGANPIGPRSRSRCGPCADGKAEYMRRLRAAKAKAGRCVCGGPLVPGRSCCLPCLTDSRIGQREKRDRRKASGVCVVCEGPQDPGSSRCRFHFEYAARASARHMARKRAKQSNGGSNGEGS